MYVLSGRIFYVQPTVGAKNLIHKIFYLTVSKYGAEINTTDIYCRFSYEQFVRFTVTVAFIVM